MSDRWVCAECGEKNIPERVNCYSCLAFKPGPRTPPGPVPLTPPDPGEHSNGLSNNKSWSCTFCNAVNSKKSRECYLCNTVKSKKKEVEGWVCKFCRTSNELLEENCRTCNAVREASVSTPSTPDVEYWLCSFCHYKASHGPYCFQCGSPKNSSIKPCPDNWECSKCQTLNFAKRSQCYSCHKKHRKRSPLAATGSSPTSAVSITCPTCKFCNQPSAKECLLCGSSLPVPSNPAPQKRRMLKTSSSSGSNPLPGSSSSTSDHPPQKSPSNYNNIPKNLFITPKDWKCQSCDYKNIALRNFCKDCDTPRKCIARLYIKYKKHGLSALTGAAQSQRLRSESPSPQALKSPLSGNLKSPVTGNSKSPVSGNLKSPQLGNSKTLSGNLKSPPSVKLKSPLRGCSKCGRPHEGPHHTCNDCSAKFRSREDASRASAESVMLKKCAQCGVECEGQYCYQCAKSLGIRCERETWECRKCHLVDENTAICMGCGHNKAEAATLATKFVTCVHCKTKNHPHKTNCVRCLKVLTPKEVPLMGCDQRPATPDTWTCKFCEISVLAKCTHCRGCNRTRFKAAKECSMKSEEPVEENLGEEEEEEGEYVEGEEGEYLHDNHHQEQESHDDEYYEEEYYESHPRHFLPPPPVRPRYPPPGPPRLPPAPRFSQPRFTGLRPRPPRHPAPRLRAPSHRPRNNAPRRQPMNLMMQHGRGH